MAMNKLYSEMICFSGVFPFLTLIGLNLMVFIKLKSFQVQILLWIIIEHDLIEYELYDIYDV